MLCSIVLGALASALIFAVLALRRRQAYARLPPGPGPSLGEAPKFPWRHWHALSKEYGPVVTVWDGARPSVICNDVASAEFFLEKHARDTADRPRSIVGDEIFSHGKRILLVGHNERWRRLRKALHHVLQPQSARDLRAYQESAARSVIVDILDQPDMFQSHIQTYAATLVVHMAYGRTDRAKYSDPEIRKVVVGAERLGTLLRPGAFKVESYPWLRYVPGYMKTVNAWAADELDLFRSALAGVKARLPDGRVAPCFATYLLDHQGALGLDDDEVAYLLGSVFGAGSDTSASAIAITVMAAAVYPEQQRRVQAELDEMLGGRMPTFEDMDDLPILKAFVAESCRWRPVSSGGFRHRTTKDIAYGTYVVPAGTPVTGNHWGIHRDEAYYGPNVEDFNLERWLDNPKLKHYQFGFGRRVCPGQHVANNSVLINCALLLWAFEIGKKQQDGRVVEIDTLAFTPTANSHPLPFQVVFTARHENLPSLIE